jgi:hypothetical protein
LERLNTNLQNWGGQKRLAEIGDKRKAQYISEYHPLERLSNPVFQKKKNHRTSRARRADRASCIACNTENGSTVCPGIRGGSFYLSRPLCLITKKSRYPKTA